jgi:hypothetical protein
MRLLRLLVMECIRVGRAYRIHNFTPSVLANLSHLRVNQFKEGCQYVNKGDVNTLCGVLLIIIATPAISAARILSECRQKSQNQYCL